MTWAASVARTHPTELHSTLRDRYGVSWTWAGTTALPWPEAIHLVHAAAEDPSTALGAAIAGWDYPAEVTDLMLILAVGGKAAEAFMPYAHKHTAKAQAAFGFEPRTRIEDGLPQVVAWCRDSFGARA